MMIHKELCYMRLQDVRIDFDTDSYIQRIAAEVVDMRDKAIVQACIKAAKEAGIHDLYLLNKEFVLNALMDKIDKTERARWEKDAMKQYPGGFMCSRCRTGFLHPYPYCPNCGAKMDGDQHDSC